MDGVIFFYYLLCYSVGVVAVIVAVLTAWARKTIQDRRFALFIGDMTVMVLSFTVGSYLLQTGNLVGPVATTVGLVNVAADSLLVFTLPFFVHSVVPVRRASSWTKVWGAVALVVCVAGVLSMLVHGSPFVFTFLFAAMGVSVAYATLTGIVYLLRRRRSLVEGMPSEDRSRWTTVLAALPLTSAAYLPFFVIFDLFPHGFPSLTGALSPTFKVFPSFYAIITGLYVATTVPSLVKGRPPHEGPGREGRSAKGDVPPGLDALDLSPREREVAALLLEGRTYKEIADNLFVSLATVKTHVERIYKKTGAANKMELLSRTQAGPRITPPR